MKKLILICALNFMFILVNAQKDTSFWFATPSLSTIDSYQYDRPTFFKFSTFDQSAIVTISMPANTSFAPITLNIAANSHQSIDMTPYINQIESQPSNVALNKGLHISSTSMITAYYEAAGISYANPDIFTLKGKNSIGKLFYIPFQDYSTNCSSETGCEKSSFDIIATENNTTVFIKPTKNIDGHVANVEFSIILNKGQVYSAKASGRLPSDHLGGSKVSSDKPVAITIKDDLTNNFANGYCQDLIGDQMIPVEKLGTDFILVKGDLNINDRFYICATQPNTTIQVNGTTVTTTLGEGQMYSGSFSGNSAYINSSAPICILHTTGFGCEMGGAIIPPLSCTGSKEIVLSRTTNDYFALMIIAKTSSINNFTLNNNATLIPASSFTIVPNTSNIWSYAKISYTSATLPSNSFIRVKNSLSNFHLAVINGQQSVTGCRYGFFSEFNKSELEWARTNHAPLNNYCIGDTIKLFADTVEDGNTINYTWTGPNSFNSNLQHPTFIANGVENSGIYTVTANNGTCPTEPISLTITVNSPSISLPNDTTICFGDQLTLTANGTYTSCLWSNGSTSPTITIGNAGTYWVKGMSGSCESSDTIHVFFSQNGQFSLGNDTIVCNGSNLNLTAPSGSYSYLWSNGTTGNSLNINQTGTYWLQIDNASICPYRDSITVTFANPSIHLPDDTIICSGTQLVLTPTGTFNSLLWSNGLTTPTIQANTTGTYWVKGIINSTCFALDTIHVTVLMQHPFSLGNDSILCDTSNVILSGPAGSFQYLWSDGTTGNQINVQQSGQYWLMIRNDSICPTSDTVNLTFVPIPNPDLGSDRIVCDNQPITISDGLTTGISTWSNGIVGHSIFVNNSGTYWVTNSATHNCSNSDTIIITAIQAPPLFIGNDTTLCQGQTLILNAGSDFDSYLWNTGDTCAAITISETGNYTIHVSDGPCSMTDNIEIQPCPCTIWTPNTFTPNFDNYNDTYFPVIDNVTYLNMKIFNRWGELLYEGTGLNSNWDGSYKGKMCPEGVYFCVVKYKCDYTLDKLFQISTSVTLIK